MFLHMMTTVLAFCVNCGNEVVARILDCDDCYVAYLEGGGDPQKYSDLQCEHLRCLICDESLGL